MRALSLTLSLAAVVLQAAPPVCTLDGEICVGSPIMRADVFMLSPGYKSGQFRAQQIRTNGSRFRTTIPLGAFRFLVVFADDHQPLVVPMIGDGKVRSLTLRPSLIRNPSAVDPVDDHRLSSWTRTFQEILENPATNGAGFMIPLRILLGLPGPFMGRYPPNESMEQLGARARTEPDLATRQFLLTLILALSDPRSRAIPENVQACMDRDLTPESPFWALNPCEILGGRGWSTAREAFGLAPLRKAVLERNPDPEIRSALVFHDMETNVEASRKRQAEEQLQILEKIAPASHWLVAGRKRLTEIPLQSGDPLPAFDAWDENGRRLNLQNASKRPLVLHVWEQRVSGLTREIETLKSIHREFGGRGLSILSLRMDTGNSSTTPGLDWPSGVLRGSIENPLWIACGKSFPAVLLLDANKRVRFRVTSIESMKLLNSEIEKLLQETPTELSIDDGSKNH